MSSGSPDVGVGLLLSQGWRKELRGLAHRVTEVTGPQLLTAGPCHGLLTGEASLPYSEGPRRRMRGTAAVAFHS